MPRLNEIISMRLNYEDSEKLEELADDYGLKVSTYCRAILKGSFAR